MGASDRHHLRLPSSVADLSIPLHPSMGFGSASAEQCSALSGSHVRLDHPCQASRSHALRTPATLCDPPAHILCSGSAGAEISNLVLFRLTRALGPSVPSFAITCAPLSCYALRSPFAPHERYAILLHSASPLRPSLGYGSASAEQCSALSGSPVLRFRWDTVTLSHAIFFQLTCS